MQPLISIIMPIYNAANTIQRSIECVLKQTLHDWELILIDDGSTDDSLQICNQYAKKDPRIIVHSQENSGVSRARNEGIQRATAPYVQFVDCDDVLKEDMCKRLYDTMESKNCELVICGYIIERELSRIEKRLQNSEGEFDFLYLYKEYFLNPVWNKLYKRELISNLFHTQINAGEDLLFNIQYLSEINTIGVVEDALYVYRAEDKNRISGNSFKTLTMIYSELYKYVGNKISDAPYIYEKIDERYLKEYIYYLKLAARKRQIQCDWKTERKFALEIGERNKFTSFLNFVCWVIMKLKLERMTIILFGIFNQNEK